MEAAILDKNGKDTGKKITLSAEIFGIEPNDHAIYLDVKQYLANQRQGTHKSKQRNEISGSSKKLKLKIEEIISSVENSGGEINIMSTENITGEQLVHLGSIIGILRYKL